jgi:hypothetical protein
MKATPKPTGMSAVLLWVCVKNRPAKPNTVNKTPKIIVMIAIMFLLMKILNLRDSYITTQGWPAQRGN